MSDIHINRSGQNLGIFPENEVQEGLNTGKFVGTDVAWKAGMENWQPLSKWSEFIIPAGIPPITPNSAVTGLPPAFPEERNLPSWEQKSETGFFTAFAATVKEVLLEPSATFARMKETGGFLPPFVYMLIATVIGVVLSLVMQFGMQTVFGSMAASQNAEVARIMAAQGIGLGLGFMALLIFLPIAIFVGSFIGSGLWHAALLVLGGATKPYQATYRVYCYSKGSTSLVGLVPCCGPFAAAIWNIVAGTIGLSKVHQISTGKALLAILMPLILCCSICLVGFYFSFQALTSNPEFMKLLNSGMNSH